MKCNVANGWCTEAVKKVTDKPYFCMKYYYNSTPIKDCTHRKRMNRLEKAHGNCLTHSDPKFWDQWQKEKEK